MSEIDSVITVNIVVQDTAIRQAGFGTPGILTHENFFGPNLVQEFADTASMILAGADADGATVAAVGKIFSQNPSPPTVKILKRGSTQTAMVVKVTVAQLFATTKYTVTINGTAFDFTSDATPTALEIAAGLVSAINGGTEPVTALDNVDGTFDLTKDGPLDGTLFSLDLTFRLLTQDNESLDDGIAADYAAVKLEDPDFYGVSLTSTGKLEIAALATVVEADKKIFVMNTSDDDVLADTAGNIMETTNAAGLNRTSIMYNQENFDFSGPAWQGSRLPTIPGSSTWKFNQLPGVTLDDLNPTEISNIDSNKGNHYTPVGGVAITREGTMASGRFIDITRGIDWLDSRIGEELLGLLINSEKVKFTDEGITAIQSRIEAVLLQGVANGLLAADPEFTVTVPLAKDVSANDKALRQLTGVKFKATLAGAIHSVVVNGEVTV